MFRLRLHSWRGPVGLQARAQESLPAAITSWAGGAVARAGAALTSLDSLACGGLEQLVERVPALRKELPELYQDSRDSVAERVFAVTTLLASFTVCQVALKAADSSFGTSDRLLVLSGAEEEGGLRGGLRGARALATAVRMEGARKNGRPAVLALEDAGLLLGLAELSGLLGRLGLGPRMKQG